MKKCKVQKFTWKKAIFLLFVVVCFNYRVSGQKKSPVCFITIENTSSSRRDGEVVGISRKQLKEPPKGYLPVISINGTVLVSQLTDEDGDGFWDNLLLLIDLPPSASRTVKLTWLPENLTPKFAKKTNVRFSLKTKSAVPEKEIRYLKRTRGFTQNIADPVYQMEGPGIENDKVAFRAFFDSRNTKDIYGKITNEPILSKVGIGSSWHSLQDWGMDIFKTGNSLGAGGLAVKEGERIYRLADADTSTFQYLYSGPLKAAFRLSFKNWDVGSGKGNGSETISMTRGDYFYKDDVVVSLSEKQQLVSGIANFSVDYPVLYNHSKAYSSVATYGPQAEGTATKLGVAILFPNNCYDGYKTTDAQSIIPNTTYIVLKNMPKKVKTIYFAACWEKTDARFKNENGFDNYIKQLADKLAHAVLVKFKDR